MSRRPLLLAALLALTMAGCSIPRWPIGGTLSSPYGLRLRGFRPDLHPGVDIPAVTGTPVRAMRGGTVVRAGNVSGYGLLVELDHGRDIRTRYAHLSEVRVAAGERVDGQQVIGLVGATGNATGPHLHFEIWRRGRPEDPVPLLGGMPPAR